MNGQKSCFDIATVILAARSVEWSGWRNATSRSDLLLIRLLGSGCGPKVAGSQCDLPRHLIQSSVSSQLKQIISAYL